MRRSSASLAALSLALLAVALVPSPLAAQGTVYTLQAESWYVSGCTGPSPCACPVMMLGTLSGSFRLVPLLPPLGPIFEYTVVDFSVVVASISGVPMTVEGGGLYVLDLASNTQTLTLDVLVDGVPATFTSIGAVDLIAPFPGQVQIDVFSPVAPPCVYDGMSMTASSSVVVQEFTRGDTNEDAALDISDAVNALAVLFPAPTPPPLSCLDAADANDDGDFNIADPIAVLTTLFGGGSPLPPPYPGCGVDPTGDALDCASYSPCP